MWMYVVAIILIGLALFIGISFGSSVSEWLYNQEEREENRYDVMYFDE